MIPAIFFNFLNILLFIFLVHSFHHFFHSPQSSADVNSTNDEGMSMRDLTLKLLLTRIEPLQHHSMILSTSFGPRMAFISPFWWWIQVFWLHPCHHLEVRVAGAGEGVVRELQLGKFPWPYQGIQGWEASKTRLKLLCAFNLSISLRSGTQGEVSGVANSQKKGFQIYEVNWAPQS